jgi:hypothetical protein
MPIVKASSFADLADLAAFQHAKALGWSDARAFKVGDNGIGAWGDLTARDDIPMCALPPEDWLAKWGNAASARGQKVSVTYKAQIVIGELRDTMPHRANITNGAGIDLNPGFAKAFGVKAPFMLDDVEWNWV